MKKAIVIFCFSISCFACYNSSVEAEQATKSQEQEIVIEGESLSDSMTQVLLQEHIPFELDTSKIWDDIQFVAINDWKNYKMDFDTVMKYIEHLPNPNPHFKDYFAASYSFAQLNKASHYQSYIFMNDLDESHYSESALLVTVDTNNEIIDELELAIQYGNEMQEMDRSTIFQDTYRFERQTEIVFHYIHGVGEVDSTSIKTEYYYINKHGKIVLK
jgi:hypothetical protein